MAERYTSYATSRALREAGAPQGELQSPEGETFWRSYTSKYHEDPGKKLRCQKSEGPMSETDPRAEARKLIEWYKLWNLGQPSREVDWASAVMANAVRDFAAALRAALEREEQEVMRAEMAEDNASHHDQIARLTVERDEATKRANDAECELHAETERWQTATMLLDGSGDPGTIRPEHLEAEINRTRHEADRLRAELARLTTPRPIAEAPLGGHPIALWRLSVSGEFESFGAAFTHPGLREHYADCYFTPLPRPVKPAGTVLVTAAADMSAGALEAGAASELRPAKPEPVHCASCGRPAPEVKP